MTLTKKQVHQTVSEAAGEDVLPVVEYLKGKKNISEFKIADDTRIEVNRIRNMLYRLQDSNLVTYYRKKDRKKGWYISYWTFNQKGLKHVAKSLKERKLAGLRARLLKEEANKDNFYLCPSMCARLDFNAAAELEFRCPECGQVTVLQDNMKTISYLQNQIQSLEKDLRLTVAKKGARLRGRSKRVIVRKTGPRHSKLRKRLVAIAK